MKRIALGLAFVISFLGVNPGLVSSEAQAISRYTSTAMSCASVKAAVRNEGAVILRWRSKQTGNQLYDRFVASSGYCDPGEIAVAASVPSASGNSCTVKKCKRCDFDDDDRFFRFRRC